MIAREWSEPARMGLVPGLAAVLAFAPEGYVVLVGDGLTAEQRTIAIPGSDHRGLVVERNVP